MKEVTQLEISSSAIRDLLLHEHGARYLTPAGVLKIIEATGCYAAHATEAKQEQHLHAK